MTIWKRDWTRTKRLESTDSFSLNDFRIVLKLASEKIFLTLIGMRNAKERTKMLRQSGLTLALLLNKPILHSKVQQVVEVDSLQYFIL